MKFSIQTLYQPIFRIWRRKRFALFLAKIRPRPTDILLDVGGYPHFWLQYPPIAARIDTLNLHLQGGWHPEEFPNYSFDRIVGDGCAMSFADKSYDIAFSNSVIEHLGSPESQAAFASEIMRVGRKIWVQTPAFECPIEPHYLTPFVHWLPVYLRRKIARNFTVWGLTNRPSLAQINEMVDTTRLLSKKEFTNLFPDCLILTEYMLGFIPKSYIAYRH